MSDLVAFLRACLDEDEGLTRLISAGGYAPDVWKVEPSKTDRWMWIVPYSRTLGESEAERVRDGDPIAMATSGRNEHLHIARWDPERVLAEVEAKRQILDEHDTTNWQPGDRVHDCQWEAWPCRTLRLLALPYADHPDYREEWRP